MSTTEDIVGVLPDTTVVIVKKPKSNASLNVGMRFKEGSSVITPTTTPEDLLGTILDATLSSDLSVSDMVCKEMQPPFKGDNATEKLLYCMMQQENSFWGMFYAEFWHMLNFMVSRSEQLFPEKRGFVWVASTPELPVRYMFSEDRSKGGDRFHLMADSVRRYIECILSVTPCLLRPVGRQYRFLVNLVCIERATQALVEELCKNDSFLGGCSNTCGGEIKKAPEDEEAARYVRRMTPHKSRGGAGGAHPVLRESTVHAWMAVRDMVINLNYIVSDAMFTTAMFRQVCQKLVGSTPTLEPDVIDEYVAKDPVFGGYHLRDKPTGIPILDKIIPEFNFMEFAIHIACHTGEKMIHYMPPVYLYTHHKKQILGMVDGAFYSRVWCSALGMVDRSILKKMMGRFQMEWETKHDKFPDDFEYINPGIVRMTDSTSVQLRALLNNNHHLSERQFELVSRRFVKELHPDIQRNGIDDYHRSDDTARGSSLVINWVKHLILVNEEQATLIRGSIMKTAGFYIQEGVDEVMACEQAKQDLFDQIDKEKLEKHASSKKVNRKAKRKAKRAKKILKTIDTDLNHTFPDLADSVATTPTSAPAQPKPSRMMLRIMQEGAVSVISRAWREHKERRMLQLTPFVSTLQRNFRVVASNKRLGTLQRLVRAKVHSIKLAKDLASSAIARWYQGVCKAYNSRFQIVVFDTDAYLERVRLRELVYNHTVRAFFAEVRNFNMYVHQVRTTQFLHGVMRQVEHYLVYAIDEFIYNNMCHKTASVSVECLSKFPRLAQMIHGHPIGIIATACSMSPTLRVVYNGDGDLAIHCPYLAE